MAGNRTVKVSLTAEVSQYLAGMDTAAKKTRELGSESEKLAQKKQSIEQLGRGLLVVGAAAAAGVGLAISKFAEFDQAISNIKAVTQETTSNMDLLRDAALDAGADTVFTATEAANAIEELGKAGLTTSEILTGGLDGALSLAAAGQLDVATAAGYTAIALKQFKLGGEDASHVADLLAAGAGKAVGDVDDLSQALNQTGLIAKGAGFSIEDTTGVLAAFADAGLLGSDAGTSLKNAIIKLQAPTGKASELLDQYGISVYDSNGHMKTFEGIAGELTSGLGDLDDETRNAALATIFGTDALRVANVLYTQGADGIKKYVDQTNDAGYAARVAADRLDNLKGDVEQLGGSFETFLIKSGSGANDILRLLVQSGTNAINVFGDLPTPVLVSTLGVGALAAAASLAGGAFFLAVPKLAAYRAALADMGTTAQRAGSVLGGLSKAAGAVGIAVAGFAVLTTFLESLRSSSEEVTNSLVKASDAVSILSTSMKNGFGEERFAQEYIERLNGALIESGEVAKDWTKTYSGANANVIASVGRVGKQLGELAAADLPAAQNAFRELAKETDGSQERLGQLVDAMPEYKNALIAQATAMGLNVTSGDEQKNMLVLLDIAQGDAASSTKTAADAYGDAAAEAEALQSNLSSLIDTINEANGVGQDAVSTNASYRSAIADVNQTIADAKAGVEGYSTSLDESTAAGSTNAQMFADLAGKSQDAAKAQLDLDHSATNYTANVTAGRDALYQQILDLTGNADAAQALTDKIYAIPTEAEVKILAETSTATKQIDRFIESYSGRTIFFEAAVTGSPQAPEFIRKNENGGMYNHGVKAFASGGFESGIYAGRRGGIHKFAEESLPWETYISPKPGKEKENIGYALESLARLGYQGYAGGGQAMSAPMQSTTSNSSSFVINEVTDPIGTAMAIARRQNMRAAV